MNKEFLSISTEIASKFDKQYNSIEGNDFIRKTFYDSDYLSFSGETLIDKLILDTKERISTILSGSSSYEIFAFFLLKNNCKVLFFKTKDANILSRIQIKERIFTILFSVAITNTKEITLSRFKNNHTIKEVIYLALSYILFNKIKSYVRKNLIKINKVSDIKSDFDKNSDVGKYDNITHDFLSINHDVHTYNILSKDIHMYLESIKLTDNDFKSRIDELNLFGQKKSIHLKNNWLINEAFYKREDIFFYYNYSLTSLLNINLKEHIRRFSNKSIIESICT